MEMKVREMVMVVMEILHPIPHLNLTQM